ncbi:uncharacterized protein B0T15DRAFT_552155 [Chaetomium strumarium]|uniref:MYND-type domain-containing protein n=1 Tax=Chaetomium strumarium TaxID=1170767 RepID=A0AAJ0M285_9PEZI|nr:hypothetical protein B0T15DRAFT_552155 [Chaetomium strumarium]
MVANPRLLRSDNNNIFDFGRHYVAFLPMADQVTHLVNHLIASGYDWGRMYAEAVSGRFLATHGTIHERWYNAIVSELVWREEEEFAGLRIGGEDGGSRRASLEIRRKIWPRGRLPVTTPIEVMEREDVAMGDAVDEKSLTGRYPKRQKKFKKTNPPKKDRKEGIGAKIFRLPVLPRWGELEVVVRLRGDRQQPGECGRHSGSPLNTAKSVCNGCKQASYCSRECQVGDWPLHKKVCKDLAGDGVDDKRPSPEHRRILFFPMHSSEPETKCSSSSADDVDLFAKELCQMGSETKTASGPRSDFGCFAMRVEGVVEMGQGRDAQELTTGMKKEIPQQHKSRCSSRRSLVPSRRKDTEASLGPAANGTNGTANLIRNNDNNTQGRAASTLLDNVERLNKHMNSYPEYMGYQAAPGFREASRQRDSDDNLEKFFGSLKRHEVDPGGCDEGTQTASHDESVKGCTGCSLMPIHSTVNLQKTKEERRDLKKHV